MPGHWEGDLVIGKDGKTAVATLVERTSRFLILVPLTGRDSLTVGEAIIAATGGLPAQIRRSLTWDCGAEMARHATITATGLPVYFAHPHSPWERGSNENLNRIVREYFPKGTSKSAPIRNIWRWWLAISTTDPVRFTTGRSPPSYSLNSSSQMLRLAESAAYYRRIGFHLPLGTLERPITGHIDVLQVRRGLIHILDYKPDARKINPANQPGRVA